MLNLDEYASRIQLGDVDAFAAWATKADRVLRLSLRPLAASVDVEAIMQDALLRIWQSASQWITDGQPNSLLRFALRVTRNLALSDLRKRRVKLMDDETLEIQLHEATNFAYEHGHEPDPFLRKAIVECKERLPEKNAQALLARLDDAGTSDAMLAERLGMRINTFLQNVTRARRLLAECLDKKGISIEAYGVLPGAP